MYWEQYRQAKSYLDRKNMIKSWLGRDRVLHMFLCELYYDLRYLQGWSERAYKMTLQYADGRIGFQELEMIRNMERVSRGNELMEIATQDLMRKQTTEALDTLLFQHDFLLQGGITELVISYNTSPTTHYTHPMSWKTICERTIGIIRLFCPNRFWVKPEWKTTTVVALAHQMYVSPDTGIAPILADALQDADCDNNELLDALRFPGRWPRGCWLVDHLTGRSP